MTMVSKLPFCTIDAERVFSLSKLIHSAIRNQLTVEHVKQLIIVHINGGKLTEFNAENILKW